MVTKEALELATEHELVAMQFDMTVRVLTSVISHKYDLLWGVYLKWPCMYLRVLVSF